MTYDTHHDGAVQEITYAQLTYCKVSGFYNRCKNRMIDWWLYTVLKKERPPKSDLEKFIEKMMPCVVDAMAKSVENFYDGGKSSVIGDTIEIKKPVRYQAMKYSEVEE